MGKWVKDDSRYATGSSGRVSDNMARQRASADKAAADAAKRQRQADPRSRADKNVRKGGRG